MKSFARRGFQLRSAPLETRLAYTGFLALTVPGIATLVALSVGRVGASPAAIAVYYRGGDAEAAFPRTFWQLAEVSHFHLFSIPVVALILTHLLFGTSASRRVRVGITACTFGGALLDAVAPWAIRYAAAGFAYALLLGWAMLAVGALSAVALSLAAMWAPERWLGAPEPRDEPDGGAP